MPRGICKLCNKEKDLSLSHIIPRSYYKFMKGGASQLVEIIEGNDEPLCTNGDKKEYLLCARCEDKLNRKYEGYGTVILKNRKKIVKITDDRLHFEYDYKKLYLFFSSIMWRVSVSSKYPDISLGGFDSILAYCIYNNTLNIKHPEVRVDNFLKIYLIKLTDKSKTYSDDTLRKILFDFRFERTSDQGNFAFYWVVGGFLICYHFNTKHQFGDSTGILSTEGKMLIPIADISNFKSIIDSFNLAFDMKSRPPK